MKIEKSMMRRVLGSRFDELSPVLRTMHEPGAGRRAEGRADVNRGSSILSKLFGRMLRLPSRLANEEATFTIVDAKRPGREVWRREFGGHVIETRHRAGRKPGRMLESFGPLTMVMDVIPAQGGVIYRMRGARILGFIPLPPFLRPRVEGRETEEDGLFVFESSITLPVGGRLLRYRGRVVPAEDADAEACPAAEHVIVPASGTETGSVPAEASTGAAPGDDRERDDDERGVEDDFEDRRWRPPTEVGR